MGKGLETTGDDDISARLRRFSPLLARCFDRARYRREQLRGDLVAGLTTAVMLVPQGLAYAMLAGLPPVVGLYASVAPLVIYALFGTSRRLAVGPVATDSLLVAAGVGAVAEAGTEAYMGYAILLAVMVGAMQLAMGAARLGFLVNFMSRPVISGFTSAAALIIGMSQLQHLLGISLPSSQQVHVLLIAAARHAGEISWPTVAVGGAAIIGLVVLAWVRPKFPRALAVVVLATVGVFALGLEDRGVSVVGEVPAGFPTPALPGFELGALSRLWPTALALALVSFMEAISISKAVSQGDKQRVDPNRELLALGGANIAAGIFRGFPISVGFSRSAVNAEAGANSGLAALVTAATVTLTLLVLTPLFFFLPHAALAAIIMVAVAGLVDVAQVRRLWVVNRGDLALLVLTFVSTLGLGIQAGLLVGVGASLFWFLVRTTRPHIAVLGRLPDTEVYRNASRYPEARTHPGVLALRVDAQFYFGNVSFLERTLDALIRDREGTPDAVRAVVLDAHGVNNLDSSADAALHEILADLRQQNIRLYLAGVKGPVRDAMRRSGLWKALEGRITLTVHEAVTRAACEDAGADAGGR